jgi:hypothetical protein
MGLPQNKFTYQFQLTSDGIEDKPAIKFQIKIKYKLLADAKYNVTIH